MYRAFFCRERSADFFPRSAPLFSPRDVFATTRRGCGRRRGSLSFVFELFFFFFFFSPSVPSLERRNEATRRCLIGGEEEFDACFSSSSKKKRYRRESG
jgi:hypothetical protein